MARARISPWRRMRRSRAPSNGLGRFFAAQFSAGCTTNMSGFDCRQAQRAKHQTKQRYNTGQGLTLRCKLPNKINKTPNPPPLPPKSQVNLIFLHLSLGFGGCAQSNGQTFVPGSVPRLRGNWHGRRDDFICLPHDRDWRLRHLVGMRGAKTGMFSWLAGI